MVRQSSELETNIVAVERIKEYTGITKEVCNFWNSNQTSVRLIKLVDVPSVTQIVLPHTSVIPIPAFRHSRFQSIPGLTSFTLIQVSVPPWLLSRSAPTEHFLCSALFFLLLLPISFVQLFLSKPKRSWYILLLTGWLDNSRSPSPWGMALRREDRDREFPTALQRASSPGAERHELRH